MIEARVTLNGEEFEVLSPGDVYDAERLDYNEAVKRALQAHRLEHPLDKLDVASLVVTVERVHTERASHDGATDLPDVGDSNNRQERDERFERNAEGEQNSREPDPGDVGDDDEDDLSDEEFATLDALTDPEAHEDEDEDDE
jgi:hypothetical protein